MLPSGAELTDQDIQGAIKFGTRTGSVQWFENDKPHAPDNIAINFTRTIQLYGGNISIDDGIPLTGEIMDRIKTLTRYQREHAIAIATHINGKRVPESASPYDVKHTKPEHRRQIEIAGFKTEILCTAMGDVKPALVSELTDEDIQNAITYHMRTGYVYCYDFDGNPPCPANINIDFD